ncbi:MAG: hypothetical protein HeimC3_45170 [Candidatus Heimdallarchaeota archaeon LC_3]|nr:MAG: hypothetical protein HeimC3_45170 [Candidatus Heimdallarchaeota archaeon LC_3]
MNSDLLLTEERQVSINRLSMMITEILLIQDNSQIDFSNLFIPDASNLLISYISELFNQAILSKN